MKKNQASEHDRRWWEHWTFVVAVLVSVVFLTYVIARFLMQAQMSLGPTPISDNSIDAFLISSKSYTPPSDGLLRISQVHVCLRVFEAYDSLTRDHADKIAIRKTVAEILNTHQVTKSSYAWARTTLSHALLYAPKTHTDSANVALIHMLQPRLMKVRRVITDSIDKELLR